MARGRPPVVPALVVDSSAIASIVLAEIPPSDAKWSALIIAAGALAPAHFPAEIANTLVVSVRRKRISELHRSRALLEVAKLAVEVETALDWAGMERVSDLAERNKLSVYDAIYLDLALRTGLPLATYDAQLRAAAQASGVIVL